MIELRQGDILNADAEALVNTVNCVGVMGRGIALQFRKAFPENYEAYKAACSRDEVQPGKMFIYDRNELHRPRFIINFPTKRHWRSKSRLEDVRVGLEALVREVSKHDIRSVAIPPLGCGLGGLEWEKVRPMIEAAFDDLPSVCVVLFEPHGAPAPADMVKHKTPPRMTVGRAVLLSLMRRYLAAVMDPHVTLLEIHKLMYFMQESGEGLRLRYAKGRYGPYAENLRHVLSRLEGHFILGYGDAEDRPDKPIEPLADAVDKAETFLARHPETRERFDRVVDLITGFETAYSMELLATVHWVAQREDCLTIEEAIARTYAWDPRKKMFEREHIEIAWQVLADKGWLAAPAPNP